MIRLNFEDEYIYISCEEGELISRILSDDLIEYELDGLDESFKDKFLEEIGSESSILLIERIKVEEDSRGQGIAGKLLDKLFEVAKEHNLKCLYLNASPILADEGLELESLTAFYERRGFTAILNQTTNVLMIKKIQ